MRWRWALAILVIALLFLLGFSFRSSEKSDPTLSAFSQKPILTQSSKSTRHVVDSSKIISIQTWKEELETLFGIHEWNRSQILSQKVTVDSEIYLLGVPPPSDQDAAIIQSELDALWEKTPSSRRAEYQKALSKIIADYDPFGTQGKRVIQIDLPDEPNGRLTGFTCSTEDFATITAQFDNGEMADLKNLRSFAAPYAGMPLHRFRKLITMDDSE